jgi:hypothetical protein
VAKSNTQVADTLEDGVFLLDSEYYNSLQIAQPADAGGTLGNSDFTDVQSAITSPDKSQSADLASIRPAPSVDTSHHRDSRVSRRGSNLCFQ